MATPGESKSGLGGPAAEHLHNLQDTQQRAALREKYTSAAEIERAFASPDGGMARDAWERMKFNNEWADKQRHDIVDMVRELKGKLFDAVVKRIDAKRATAEETDNQLRALDDYIALSANNVKMQESPYGERPKDETFQSKELLALRQFFEGMKQIDTDELVDMVADDQPYIDMLIQERDTESTGKLPGGALDENDPLDKDQKKYLRNMEKLVKFITGKMPWEERREKKSDFRKMSERTLWQEIIRGMDWEQRRGLVEAFLTFSSVDETKTFISRCIIAGTMTRHDLQKMYEKKGIFEKLGPDFEQYLQTSVAAKEYVGQQVQQIVESGEMKHEENAALYFLTFNKMGAETIGRAAAISAVLNGVLRIADKISARPHGQSWVTAAGKGLQDAVTDKFVWGGATVAAVMANVIHPYMKDLAYGPSTEENDRLARFQENNFLKEQANNHFELMTYFVQNYNALHKRAEATVGEHSGTLDVSLDDVKLVARQTGHPLESMQFGYHSEDLAAAGIIRMFGSCSRLFELENATKLKKYLKDNGIYSAN